MSASDTLLLPGRGRAAVEAPAVGDCDRRPLRAEADGGLPGPLVRAVDAEPPQPLPGEHVAVAVPAPHAAPDLVDARPQRQVEERAVEVAAPADDGGAVAVDQ